MSTAIARVDIRYEQDVVYTRQRARLIAELLGFDRNDQTRISTALSELARNAYRYAGAGEVEFALAGDNAAGALASARHLEITLHDRGPGITDAAAILDGRYSSSTGMGLGIIGARRLMDDFSLDTGPDQGTTIRIGKTLPRQAPPVTAALLARIAEALARSEPESPLQEIQVQNQELLRTLGQLRERQEELARVNLELEDTNRGVIALYKELEEGNDRLAQSNRLKAQFLSNMSHQFRTPLNSILAISRLLQERMDGELTAEQDKQIGFVRKSAEDLSALVNDLLDLARIESGKTVAKPQDCSAAQILGGLRGMFKPLATAPEVSLVIEEPQGIPPLYTDEGMVSQILRNLVSNALTFTQRGEIRVCTRLSGDARAVIFSVSDSGIGIAPQDQARIFEEYFQVESAQNGKAKGTGLGLPICRNLARLLGGTVSIESQPGTGSTFTAIIPLRLADANDHADATPPAARTEVVVDPTRLPVLLVDDAAETQTLYGAFLKNTPFQGIHAYSAEEAKQILGRMPQPAAIVLDVVMPGKSGLELLAEIKQQSGMRDIPVIMVSAVDESARALALGAAQYRIKPVERQWLLEQLHKAVGDAVQVQVLIIDDEEIARYILKDYLAGTRFRVTQAASGAEGLKLARAHKPEVIFLDLVMPEMSGFEVLHELKQDPALRDIPVIISTAKILDDAARHALAGDAVAVLPKAALSRDAAVAAVRQALRRALDSTKHPELPR